MNEEYKSFTPCARTEGLVVEDLEDEVVVYDLERHKARCLNRTAALVWRSCDGRNTPADIARILKRELGIAADESLVGYALNQLGRDHLLQKPAAAALPFERGISRRALMMRLGLAAVLVPVVTSITAPTAMAAVSCAGQTGCTVTPNSCPSPCICVDQGGGNTICVAP